MDSIPDPAGAAALSICESLLLSLLERGIIDDAELRGILADAAAVHREAEQAGRGAEFHRSAAELIERMLLRFDSANRGHSDN